MYVHAYDLSLSCVGLSIFTDDGQWVETTSIETDAKENHGMRLRFIGKVMLEYRKKYPCALMVCEQGFSRFPASTQAIFKTNGVMQYLYYDVEQIFLPSTTVKKIITGKGNSKKEEVRDVILEKYPKMVFRNLDESDSFSVGEAFFIRKGIIND